jgi:catalase
MATKKSISNRTTNEEIGHGGELHQIAGGSHPPLTTQTGAVVGDDENSLKAGPRGPSLLEDHILLEKIQHVDHERIPERIVHARGFGAHGYFELTDSLEAISRAAIFNQVGQKMPVFVRFSTVAGNKGSKTWLAMFAASRLSSVPKRKTGTAFR